MLHNFRGSCALKPTRSYGTPFIVGCEQQKNVLYDTCHVFCAYIPSFPQNPSISTPNIKESIRAQKWAEKFKCLFNCRTWRLHKRSFVAKLYRFHWRTKTKLAYYYYYKSGVGAWYFSEADSGRVRKILSNPSHSGYNICARGLESQELQFCNRLDN